MKPSSPSPKNQRFARKHQKKKLGQTSCHVRHSKLNIITPLPDSQVHSNYHSVKYERKESRSDKSSAGSNHDSKNKHHTSCHLNPSGLQRRYANSIKKKPAVNVVSDKAIDPCPL